MAVAGCGDDASDAPLLMGGSNSIRVLGSPTALSYDGDGGGTVEHVVLTGFDDQGTVVYRSEEVPYGVDMTFTGVPAGIASIQLDYNRGTGYALSRHSQPVDFAAAENGVLTLTDISPAALGADRDTFTVRVVNNSGYPDDAVYVLVFGLNRAKNRFYYVAFADNYATSLATFDMVNPNDVKDPKAEKYSISLKKLKVDGIDSNGRPIYSFQCPYKDNLVSGRIVFSFGKKLLGLGMTNASDPLSLRTPSTTGAPDYQTLYEFMELSATIPDAGKGPQVYTLYANTSVVDFFSIGINMTVAYTDGGKNLSKTVGFDDGARKKVLSAFDALSLDTSLNVFANYIKSDQGGIIRVLSPGSVVGWPGAPNYKAMCAFLEQDKTGAITTGWEHYTKNLLTIDDSVIMPSNPTFRYGYQYTPRLIDDKGILSMTCIVAPDGDKTGSTGEVCNLPRITSSIVFKCDADAPADGKYNNSYANLGSDGHKRLISLISAALNRGVFENYADWANPAKFYQRADKQYNHYAKIMHDYALTVVDEKGNKARRVYGFAYDDIYGQDPTIVKTIVDVNNVTITIPPVDPAVDPTSQIGANIRSRHGKRATIIVSIGATVLGLAILATVTIYRRRRQA